MDKTADGYTIIEHRHRFAIWAAGRAAQRGHKGASVAKLGEALEWADVRAFAINPPSSWGVPEFDAQHRRWCDVICKQMGGDFSYGRAAKLVAVYLKAMITCGPLLESPAVDYIHPPIDRILLTNLKKANIIQSLPSWTALDEGSYFQLVAVLRAKFPNLWKVESYWHPDASSEV